MVKKESKKRQSDIVQDENLHLIEEYKTLREEIMQNIQDNIKILQFGLTIAASLLSFAYLETVRSSGIRWLYLFANGILLAPLVMLHAERIRETWKLGYYIQKKLEPKLDFQWETFSMWTRLSSSEPEKRLTIRFIYGMTMPLILIQLLSPILSALDILSNASFNLHNVKPYEFIVWSIITGIILVLLVSEIRMTNEANNPKILTKNWDKQLGEIEKKLRNSPKTK